MFLLPKITTLKRKTVRKILLIIWILILISFWGYYIYDPTFISTQSLASFILRFESHLIITFTIISSLRAFTLLPSSSFVIAGTLLFANNLPLVLIISLIGIIFSSTSIYYFSDFMGFDEYFQERYPKKMNYIKSKLESKYGFAFIVLWCGLPIVPSDLVFYLSGALHLKYRKFIVAVLIGHIILFSFWIYFTSFISKILI